MRFPRGPAPSGLEWPDPRFRANLIYTLVHTNESSADLVPQQTIDPIPAYTEFQVSSATFSPGVSGITATIGYSDDGGTSWAYSPMGGGGGAPAGFDRNVTHIRYTFGGTLVNTSPDNTFTVTFGVRIR